MKKILLECANNYEKLHNNTIKLINIFYILTFVFVFLISIIDHLRIM